MQRLTVGEPSSEYQPTAKTLDLGISQSVLYHWATVTCQPTNSNKGIPGELPAVALTSQLTTTGDPLFEHVALWEQRLLRSYLGPLYRAGVKMASMLFIVYFKSAPAVFLKRKIWEAWGENYLFHRGYCGLANTCFDVSLRCKIRDLIQRFILIFGVWEPNTTAFIRRKLKPGDGFIDIGANIGYCSLLASRLVGEAGRV